MVNPPDLYFFPREPPCPQAPLSEEGPTQERTVKFIL